MSPSLSKPPLLPSEILRRVLRLASVDGRILLWLSGFFAILSAMGSDVPGAIAGCLAAGAGALELHGVGLLREHEARGIDSLVRSQLILLATILLYCAFRVITFDIGELRTRLAPFMATSYVQETLDQANLTAEQYYKVLAKLYQWGYVAAGIVSIFYQGGMAAYYQRRRRTVEKAFEAYSEE